MSMTMEEIIKKYEVAVEGGKQIAPIMGEDAKEIYEMLKAGLSALRPITREQVEKARWIKIYEDGEPAIEQHQIGVACIKCMNMPKDRFTESKFCPNCGRPMTDEAVDTVMERLEEICK